jgi:cytochrome c oxidase cbb3-type subunit 1
MSIAVELLLASFALSLIGLFVFIASMTRGLFGNAEEGSRTIFAPGEERTAEDPASTREGAILLQQEVEHGEKEAVGRVSEVDLADRVAADRSSAWPTLLCLTLAACWLILGSLAGLASSIKMHDPDWLVGSAWQTFGRLRPAHLSAVIYGWSSLAGAGIAIWLIPRLLKTELVGSKYNSAVHTHARKCAFGRPANAWIVDGLRRRLRSLHRLNAG